MGRATIGSASDRHRVVHAFRPQTEPSWIRIQWKCGGTCRKRRLGRLADRSALCIGILSDQRRILFRHAYTHVGNSQRRLSTTHRVRYSHSHTRSRCCMGSRFQCTANRQLLRKNAKGKKMDEPHCRRGIRHHRNILLWNDVSIKI